MKNATQTPEYRRAARKVVRLLNDDNRQELSYDEIAKLARVDAEVVAEVANAEGDLFAPVRPHSSVTYMVTVWDTRLETATGRKSNAKGSRIESPKAAFAKNADAEISWKNKATAAEKHEQKLKELADKHNKPKRRK